MEQLNSFYSPGFASNLHDLFYKQRFGEAHCFQTGLSLKKSVHLGFVLSKYEIYRIGSIILLNPPLAMTVSSFVSQSYFVLPMPQNDLQNVQLIEFRSITRFLLWMKNATCHISQ